MSIPNKERIKCRVGHFYTAGHFWLTPSPTSPELAALEKVLRIESKSLLPAKEPLQPGDVRTEVSSKEIPTASLYYLPTYLVPI